MLTCLFCRRCATTDNYDTDGYWGNCMEVRCFKIVEQRMTFGQSRDYCASENAYLASISTDIEQGFNGFFILRPSDGSIKPMPFAFFIKDYLTALLRGRTKNYYIGGSVAGTQHTGSSFFWDDNEEFSYTKWAPGNPSGNPIQSVSDCFRIVSLRSKKHKPLILCAERSMHCP
jgi:hypothetical protein